MRDLPVLGVVAALLAAGCGKPEAWRDEVWTAVPSVMDGSQMFKLSDGSQAVACTDSSGALTRDAWNARLGGFCRFRDCPLWADGSTRFAVGLDRTGRWTGVLTDATPARTWWIMGDFKDGLALRERLVALAQQLGYSGSFSNFTEVPQPSRQVHSIVFEGKRLPLPASWFDADEALGGPPNWNTDTYYFKDRPGWASTESMSQKRLDRMKAGWKGRPILGTATLNGHVLVIEGTFADRELRSEVKDLLARVQPAKLRRR